MVKGNNNKQDDGKLETQRVETLRGEVEEKKKKRYHDREEA